jgi:hypothetical protein
VEPFGIDFVQVHAAHAIIFGVAPRFLSPVKKMLCVFAMLYNFFARDSFFFQEAPKSGAVAIESA